MCYFCLINNALEIGYYILIKRIPEYKGHEQLENKGYLKDGPSYPGKIKLLTLFKPIKIFKEMSSILVQNFQLIFYTKKFKDRFRLTEIKL